jgi:hypothetical protein
VDAPACRTCQGPVRAGYAQCYQCDAASRVAGGLLADAVALIGYAVKGDDLARDLRAYKSDKAGAAAARDRLGLMLREFLDAHGSSVWQAAGMAAAPTVLAVVPSGQGRPGDHPLLGVAAAAGVRLARVRLDMRPEGVARGRFVSTEWLRVRGEVAGRDVLILDDTWVSGASAQSAAATLKLAGAARVAAVVLGRHLDPADPRSADFIRSLVSRPNVPIGTKPAKIRPSVHNIIR